MASKSRWADEDPESDAIIAKRKREKEEKRKAKAEKQQREHAALAAAEVQAKAKAKAAIQSAQNGDTDAPPSKRRRYAFSTLLAVFYEA